MFDEEQHVADAGRAAIVDERALQLDRGGVRDMAEVAYFYRSHFRVQISEFRLISDSTISTLKSEA